MPAFVLLLGTAALAGCAAGFGTPRCQSPQPRGADCSYGLNEIVASAWFLDDEWNVTRAADGIRAAGFAVEGEIPRRAWSTRTFEAGNVSLAAAQADNGTFRLEIEIVTKTGLGLTQAEVNALGERTEREHDARAEAILRAFENATGWRRDTPRAWMRGMVVA